MPPIGPDLAGAVDGAGAGDVLAAGERPVGDLVVDPEREHQAGRGAADVAGVDLHRERELEVDLEDHAEHRPTAGRAGLGLERDLGPAALSTTTSMVLPGVAFWIA